MPLENIELEHCRHALLGSERVPNPQIRKPLLALQYGKCSVLGQIIQVSIWIDHVKDHRLALLWLHVHALCCVSIAPTRETGLAASHSFVQIYAQIDGTRHSFRVTEVMMGWTGKRRGENKFACAVTFQQSSVSYLCILPCGRSAQFAFVR